MNIRDLQIAIENSTDGRVRIEAGKPGTEDYDTGYAFLSQGNVAETGIIEVGNIVVKWDSGVQTVVTPRSIDETFRVID